MDKNKDIDKKPHLSTRFIETGGLMMDYRHEATPIVLEYAKTIEDAHFHNFCEIYYNISGNVKFMVGNDLYNISKGDIIITKPNEFHQCLFNENCIHEHICIWLDTSTVSPILSPFLDRELGQKNIITLPSDKKELFLSLCLELEKVKDDANQQIKTLSVILQIITLIDDGLREYDNKSSHKIFLPEVAYKSLNYINIYFNKITSIKEVADKFFVSQSTLDRNFKKYFNISPKKYMETKKILYAKHLLEQGKSVTDACFDSGFNDCSHFIAIFKKYFKTTPYKIRKKSKGKLKVKSIEDL